MIAGLLARWIGAKWAGLIADLLPFLAVAAAVWWGYSEFIHVQHKLAQTEQALAAEKQAREHDVAGLTALARGQAKVAEQSRTDQKILAETVNASAPQPSSPALVALVNGLRAADSQQHPTAPK